MPDGPSNVVIKFSVWKRNSSRKLIYQLNCSYNPFLSYFGKLPYRICNVWKQIFVPLLANSSEKPNSDERGLRETTVNDTKQRQSQVIENDRNKAVRQAVNNDKLNFIVNYCIDFCVQ